jgi:hypothetical protein
MGTKLRSQGVPLDVIGDVLGHADKRSTGVYAKLADQAVVDALMPNRVAGWSLGAESENDTQSLSINHRNNK